MCFFLWTMQGAHCQLSEYMKKILTEATNSFMQNGCQESPTPTFVQQHLPSVNTQWQPNIQRYLALPYMLWDPLSQFPIVFLQRQLDCPLGLEENVANPLTVSNNWRNGISERQQPRIIFHVGSCAYLVSRVYTCKNSHEIFGNHPHVLENLPAVYHPFQLTHQSGFSVSLIYKVSWAINREWQWRPTSRTFHYSPIQTHFSRQRKSLLVGLFFGQKA